MCLPFFVGQTFRNANDGKLYTVRPNEGDERGSGYYHAVNVEGDEGRFSYDDIEPNLISTEDDSPFSDFEDAYRWFQTDAVSDRLAYEDIILDTARGNMVYGAISAISLNEQTERESASEVPVLTDESVKARFISAMHDVRLSLETNPLVELTPDREEELRNVFSQMVFLEMIFGDALGQGVFA